MRKVLEKGHTIILLGTGGVGKTTIAAALGMAGALKKLNTAVVTVDPAHRLRDALGLSGLGAHPRRLDARRLRQAGVNSSIKLSAMQLDVKRQWDSLVERFIADPAARERILNNRFYRSLAGQFAGSDAYAALEQLYDLHESGGFELEVVDTPPVSQAFEFLQAPGRLIRLLDSASVRWLFAPHIPGRHFALRLANRAGRLIARELEEFAGTTMLFSISDFFISAAAATRALVDRFRKAEALLRSPAVHFVVVTTPEPDRIRQASELIAEMAAQDLTPALVVVNRFLDEQVWSEIARKGRLTAAASLPSALNDEIRKGGSEKAVLDFIEQYSGRLREDIDRVKDFVRHLNPETPLVTVPELFTEVGGLATLVKIAEYLIAEESVLPHTPRVRVGSSARGRNRAE
ncbi:MAG: ArsA family ATPase [Candidatus Binataceae bacterium]